MDDLISRKQALEHISAWQQANAGAETQTEYTIIESCYRMMQNLPTAYSVEAVVRELEEESNGFFVDDEELGEMFVKTIPLPLAIEIVKRGGRNEID